MLVEKAPWRIAFVCALLLVPSWRIPKTVRNFGRDGQEIQGWGWQNVATWAAVVVVIALVAGGFARPDASMSAIFAALAAAAFGGAAFETARTWIDLTKEAANPDLCGYAGADYVLRPAPDIERTLGIAIVGAAASLVLLGTWLRPGDAEW
jgi:hypothetical protein